MFEGMGRLVSLKGVPNTTISALNEVILANIYMIRLAWHIVDIYH